jgi:rhodanese-related sulfurtransferase
MVAGLTACAAPSYTYAADKADHAYFKVPASWPQVDPVVLSGVQNELSRSAAGVAGGTFAWSRAYDAAAHPAPLALLVGSDSPAVYASVQNLNTTLRDQLSFDAMRNILLPVTSAARQSAAASGFTLTGFHLLFSETIYGKDGVRGINEAFEYTIKGRPDLFDLTVATNGSTTKLYLLLVQCYQACYVAHQDQIVQVVDSFTVRGS